MKYPDRVKQAVTGSTATLTLGAAVAPYRTLADAIATGDVAVGNRVSVCTEDAAGNAEWSYYTIASGTQLTRESVYRSSGTVTFPATAFCTVFGKDLVVTRDVAFSTSIPLTHPGAAYMAQQSVTGALAFTPAAAAVRGALVYLRLVANGTNAPTFSGFKEWNGSAGYDNTNGVTNVLQFFYDGTDAWYSIGQEAAAAGGAATVSTVTVSPSIASLSGGGNQTFTAVVAGTNSPAQTVTWSASAGSITSGGVFTAPAATGSTQTITITATSTVDNTKSGTATVTIASNASTVSGVTVSPSAPSVTGMTAQQFSATVAGTGSPSQAVAWTASAGTINSSGLFTAPAATGSEQTITVTATSTQDGTKSGTATVTVPVAVAPGAPTIGTATAGDSSASVAFTAPASNGGSAITGYTVTSSPGGITASGASSPINVTGLTNGIEYTFTVTATNAVDTGPASAPSNGVTPSASTPMRLSPLANMTESGTGPYVYTGNGTTYGSVVGGIASKGLQSGVDGSLSQKFTGYVAGAASGGSAEAMLGVQSGSTVVAFASLPYAFYTQRTGSQYVPFTSGSAQTPTNVVIPQDGDIMRLRRSGTSLIAEVARAGTPTSFTTIYTWNSVSSGALKFQSVTGSKAGGTITDLTAAGLA